MKLELKNKLSQSLIPFVYVLYFVGCHHGGGDKPEVESAAFEVTDSGALRVREDLNELLVFKPVSPSNMAAELEGFGRATFAPGASYAVRVPFDGIIESVEVESGADIEANQVLARLRSSELARIRGDVLRVGASLEAERDAVEKRTLLVGKGVAERVVIEGRGRVKALEAELEGLQNGLKAARADEGGGDLYTLRALRAGEVLSRNIEPGENVETADQEPAFLVGDPNQLVIMASFPERDASLLCEGETCKIIFPSLGHGTIPGTLTAIVHMIEPGSRTIRCLFRLDAQDERLRAEMSARVIVQVPGKDLLVVPRSAVLLRRDKHVVLVRSGEREVTRREVQIGINIGQDIQILTGLDAGDEVVVENAVLIDGELDRLF